MTRVSPMTLAGRPARLSVSGEELADVLQAAFRLLLDDTAPAAPTELSIEAWDVRAHPGSAPELPELPGARVWPMRRGRFVVSADGRHVVHDRPGMRAWMDRTTGRMAAHVEGLDAMELPERVRPFHMLVTVWLGDHGFQLAHAALVARAGRGILVAGPSGAGKTTTALACLEHGFQYLGDDNVAIETSPEGRFTGHGLYATACAESADVHRFPWIAASSRGSLAGEAKEMLYPAEARPGSLARQATIEAIVLPRVRRGAVTRLYPATWSEAMLALAPSSLLFLPTPAAAGVRRLGLMAQRLPRWWLDLGERSAIGARVEEALEAALSRDVGCAVASSRAEAEPGGARG